MNTTTIPSTAISYDAFLAQYAPPRPPIAASLDLDAGAVIRLTRRADDGGYERVTFSSSSAPIPTPPSSAKQDEHTITIVKRGADALAALGKAQAATPAPRSVRRSPR